MSDTQQYAYVGIAQCGCAQAVAVDSPDHPADTRREVTKMLRWGHVERWTVQQAGMAICFARHRKHICPHPGACPDMAKAVAA